MLGWNRKRTGIDRSPLRRSLVSSLLYVTLCALYIAVSSQVASTLAATKEQLLFIESVKGLGFVLVTGCGVFVLTYAHWRWIHDREQRLRVLFEGAGDAIFVVDMLGRIRQVNARASSLTGYSEQQLLGMSILQIDSLGDAVETIEWASDGASGAGSSSIDPNRRIERCFRRADGVVVPVEISVSPVRTADGPRWMGIVRDITGRKRIEEELGRHREHLEELVRERTEELSRAKESAEGALARLRATQDQLIESEKLAVLGRLAAGVAHEVNSPLGAIASSIETIKTSCERVVMGLEVFARWTRDGGSGKLSRLLTAVARAKPTTLSTRERRALRDRLLLRLETLDGIDTSHVADILVDLNLPDSHTDYIECFRGEEGATRLELLRSLANLGRGAAIIETAGQRAARIILALQTYAQRNGAEEIAPFDVRQEIDTVLTLYCARWKSDVEVVRQYDGEVPLVPCRRQELNQAWTNLVLNALQAMDFRGRLTVAVRSDADRILVSITDTGCGISEEQWGRVFEPFFTTKPRGEGCGLGLHVVRTVVTNHGGQVGFESKPGHGTTFRVELPLNRGPAGPCVVATAMVAER